MEDAEGGVHVGELEVDGAGGQDAVALEQAARHLGHVVEALEVVEVDVGHVPAAQFLKNKLCLYVIIQLSSLVLTKPI